MKTLLVSAALLILPASAITAAGSGGWETAFLPNGGEYAVDRFIVTTAVGVPPLTLGQAVSGIISTGVGSLDLLCSEQNITSIEPFYNGPVRTPGLKDLIPRMYIFHVAAGADVIAARNAFGASPGIECADLYDIPHPVYLPNDPQRTSQYHLGRVEAYAAWDIIRGDTTRAAIISIVDTGVYWTHPDLAPNMWINVPEDIDSNGTMDDGDYNGEDDDGNGYIDDVIGWDFGRNDNNPAEDAPIHGTHVAGCASEATDNGLNGAGIGFSARIMAVKGATHDTLNAVYQGMVWASENGAHIINCSWGGGGFNQAYQNLINGIWANGVVVIAAAGNDNSSQMFYPAAYNNVVAVAATNSTDHKASFSNYGAWIDVSAPGQGIFATWGPSSMYTLDGTSMASPITCGVAALIKAANPGWTNDQIVMTLISTTDNIDDLNPSYRGMLGSGRVNAFNAVGAGNRPNIQIIDSVFAEAIGDGDSLINPGETFSLVLYVQNVWSDAHNVSILLDSDDFTFIDSSTTIGDMLHNQYADNSGDPFMITAGPDMIPDDYAMNVIVTADDYIDTLSVTANITLNQRGYPKDIPGNVDSSPLVYDLNHDAVRDIIFGASDHNVYVLKSDGSNLLGWPKAVTDEVISGPAVGDIDHNGVDELVAVSKDGKIYAWRANGASMTGFPVDKGGLMNGGPLLVDIDNNNSLEIVVGSFTDNRVYVIDNNGSDHPGWPTSPINKWQGSPAAGDIDEDQLPEIVYAGFDSSLHVWNADGSEVAGFRVHLDGTVWTTAAIGDVNNDSHLEIAVTTNAGSCYLINHDGTIASGFPVHYATMIRSTPCLADLNSDNDLEIIFGTSDSRVHALDAAGAELSGFPFVADGAIFGSPNVGDISGDSQPDIVFGCLSGSLYAVDRHGSLVRNFPIPSEGTRPINASTALSDLDRDGDMEIIVPIKALGGNLEVIDYKEPASMNNLQWPNFGKENRRTNNYEVEAVAANDRDVVPAAFSLAQNYPNPFNAVTSIRFSLKSDGEACLSIFDLLGRKVTVLQSGRLTAGDHIFTWNGTDQSANSVTSGVYFYRLDSGEGTLTRRMVLLK